VLRRLPVLLVALVFVVVAAGCGGGDESSASGDTTATETVTEETTATDEATTETSGDETDAILSWAPEDCQSLITAYVGLSAAIAAASGGQDVSGDIEEFSKYVDEVPEEIREDVRTLATAYGEFIDELEAAGFTPGEVPTADQIQALEAASQSVGSSEVQAASERLTAWTDENCS
jgi:hypothetical protein